MVRETQHERRRWPRVVYAREVVVYAAMRRLRCRGRNLGAGGMCIEPPRGATPAERLRLNIALGEGKTIALEGKVVRKDSGDPGCWGVSFDRVPRAIRDQLTSFIGSQAPASEIAENASSRHVKTPRAQRETARERGTSHERRAPSTGDSERWTARPSTPTLDVPAAQVADARGERPTQKFEAETPNRQERETYGRKTARRSHDASATKPPLDSDTDTLEALRKRHHEMARKESAPDDPEDDA